MIDLRFILFFYYKAFKAKKKVYLLTISDHGLYRKIAFILTIFLKYILQLFKKSVSIDNSQGIVYVHTKNNIEAIKPLLDSLPTHWILSFYNSTRTYEKKIRLFPILPKHIFYLLKIILIKKKYPLQFDQEFIKKYKILFIEAYFYFNYFKSFLDLYKPSFILFSNDHHLIPRTLLLAAKQANIKTIYIQHASVSELFPPLDFSLSLLEGKDALKKYSISGENKAEVRLVGMLKADQYKALIRKSRKVETIGICFNMNDDLDSVTSLYKIIKRTNPNLKIIVRPHPAENRSLKKIINQEAIISNSKLSGSFEFLKTIDILIAGDSSIHLEATLLGIVSFYYKFNADTYDYYSFLKYGLITEIKKSEDFMICYNKLKKHYPNVRIKAKYFNDVIDTPFDWNSKALAIKYINDHVSNEG